MTTLATTTHALFIAVGRAVELGYAVGFVSPEEWERSYGDEVLYRQRRGELVEVWQELASLGWQNFIADGTDIVVRWEKAD